MTRRRHPDRSAGIALIAVLWTIVLLTLIATVVLRITRTEGRVARRFADVAQAEAAADSAINLTLLRIGTRTSGQSGPQFTAEIGSLPPFAEGVSVSVQSENERVDLNSASMGTLTACFLQGGAPEAVARSMAARVIDWRDPDDVAEPGGAEESDYRAAGLNYGPRNGPFQTVEELRRVLGMESLPDSTLNRFTTYSHEADDESSDGPDTAGEPGMGTVSFHCGGPRAARQAGGGAFGQESFIGKIVRVHACATERVHVCRLVVARLTGNTQSPFQIFVWRTEAPPAS